MTVELSVASDVVEDFVLVDCFDVLVPSVKSLLGLSLKEAVHSLGDCLYN